MNLESQKNQQNLQVKWDGWGVGLALKAVFETELITAVWELKKETIEERFVPISAHLTGFYNKYGKNEKYFKEVDLDDPFFKKITVDVMCNANFEEDPIHSIITTLRYNDPQNRISKVKSFLFKNSDDQFRFESPQPNINRYKYEYKVDVNYKPSRHFTNLREEGKWQLGEERKLVINKNSFGLINVDIMLASPLEDVRFVKLDLFYEDTANGYQQRESKLFNTGEELLTWQIPIKDINLRKYKYRATVYTNQKDPEGKYIIEEHNWVETEETCLILEI